MDDKNERSRGILLESGTNEVEFLRFKVCGQSYGINVAKVRQTVLLKDQVVTALPYSKPEVTGITYFREKPITVIDLRQYLGLQNMPRSSENLLLLVTEFNRVVSGFVVDEVDRIARCSWKQFSPLEENGGLFGDGGANVVGTVTLDNEIVVILDVETILGSIIPSASVDSCVGKIAATESLDRGTMRIVYCEDSTIVQKVLLKTLTTAGFKEFKIFPTGLQGLDYLKTQPPGSVDIILSDIEMPHMDGLTLCREARKLPALANVPFIFFSSMVNEEMKRKCTSVGGNAAYSKPEVHLIVSAIDEVIAKRTQKSA